MTPRKHAVALKGQRSFRGDRLRLLREQMKMTQDEFEKMLGFGSGVISRYESGSTDPLPNQLVEMSRRLEVSVDWLLGLTDNPEAVTGQKTARAPDPKNLKEMRFLEKLRNGEFMALINELSSDALLPPPTQNGSENAPKEGTE